MTAIIRNPSIATYFASEAKLNNLMFDESEESLEDDFQWLKIKSGEKIVVDFENEDGWTWRDEHSGPFSWMTNSQQDLTLEEIFKSESKEKKKNRPPSSFDPTKGNEEQLYSPNKYPLSEIEAAFQKFGITLQTEEDEKEESKGDQQAERAVDTDGPSRTDEGYSASCSKDSSFYSSTLSSSTKSASPENTIHSKSPKKYIQSFIKWPWGKKKHEHKADSDSMSLPLSAQVTVINSQGLVSPVFEDDENKREQTDQPKMPVETYDNVPVESAAYHSDCFVSAPISSDNLITSFGVADCMDSLNTKVNTDDIANVNEDATASTVYIEPSEESTDFVEDQPIEKAEDNLETTVLSKTGFDFLDNW